MVVRFTTRTSLRQSVTFLLTALPKAGYLLGRGDAEAREAEAPFHQRGTALAGEFRLAVTGSCQTSWVLALSRPTGMAGTSAPPAQLAPAPLAGTTP